MTDSSPTTEAGRDVVELLTDPLANGPAAWDRDLATDSILAIEQQAREGGYRSGLLEGRQEAVRDVQAYGEVWGTKNGREFRIPFDDLLRVAGLNASEPQEDEGRPSVEQLAEAMWTALSDNGRLWIEVDSPKELHKIAASVVAGLEGEGRSPIGSNTSESLPTRCGCQCHGPYVWDVCPHCRPDLLGDASESPPTEWPATARDLLDQSPEATERLRQRAGLGDASESGQPTIVPPGIDPSTGMRYRRGDDPMESGQPPEAT